MKKELPKKFPRRLLPLFLFILILFAASILFVSCKEVLIQASCGCVTFNNRLSGEFDATEKIALFGNKRINYPFSELQLLSSLDEHKEDYVLGETAANRWVEIDLSDQRLYAHQDDRIVYEFLISSGKLWTPTRPGEFRVQVKIRYAKMSGGSQALGNYYYLPNVPFIQYYNGDYGLHGAYWHNNFGQTMSHGCVNLPIPDAEKLFYWTKPDLPSGKNIAFSSEDNLGTRILIHE